MSDRFYLPDLQQQSPPYTLEGKEWHHAQTVMRKKPGDRMTLIDGKGSECLVEMIDAQPRQAKLRPIQMSKTPRPAIRIVLAQAMTKGKAMDLIIQKSTELGVSEIIPVLSDRTVTRMTLEDGDAKRDRWKDIVIDAAKQCGLNWIPTLSPILTMKQLVESRPAGPPAFIASLQPDSKRLWDYASDLSGSKQSVLLVIGPEGDFTPAEIAMARSNGFLPLGLGPLVLRSETAAIHALSTLSYELSRISILQPVPAHSTNS